MPEPYEQPNEENNRIQLDRDVLSAMLKAWMIPRSTGNLAISHDENYGKDDQPANDQTNFPS